MHYFPNYQSLLSMYFVICIFVNKQKVKIKPCIATNDEVEYLVNILISVDQNYLDKAKTMLFSLSMHTNEQIVVYLLNHRLSNSEVKEFSNYMRKLCKIEIVDIDVKDTELDDSPVGDAHFTVEMYYRILTQFLLPQEVERVLWLDCDIIILKSIDEFYHQDFNKKKYVVCLDRGSDSEQLINQKEKLGLPKDYKYFNSGVMLMNLAILRETTDREEIVKKIKSIEDKLLFPDQDVLNVLYQNQVQYADGIKYNYQVRYDNTLPSQVEKDISILHYCSPQKPWNYWNLNDVSIFYWKVKAKQGKIERKESKNIYKNKIVDCFSELKKYVKFYLSI